MSGNQAIRLAGVVLFWVLLIGAAVAEAATYFVDQNHPQADDRNPGSEEQPWRTLRHAMSVSLKPGDTVIVRPGVYDASGGTWNRPALNPATSGTADAPITFRAEPRHGARLDAGGYDSPIGSFARDYVVIDGFEIESSAGLGVMIFGHHHRRVRGVVVQNMKVHGMRGAGAGNTDGIRVENATGAVVRNNEIFDITNSSRTTNASGVKLYYSDNIVVENNLIYDVVAGVKEKEEGQDIHIRRNYIHSCLAGMELMNQNHTTTARYHFYQNIVAGCTNGFIGQTSGTAPMRDINVYNNLFYHYTNAGVSGTRRGEGRRIWNNIFVPHPRGSYAEITMSQDPPRELVLSDYNLFAREPAFVVGLYSTNRWFRSLSSWHRSGLGFDQHSVVADPRLRNPAAGDFRLADDSPALGFGRLDARPTGAPVNAGPYLAPNDVIGIVPDDFVPPQEPLPMPPLDPLPPVAPADLRVH